MTTRVQDATITVADLVGALRAQQGLGPTDPGSADLPRHASARSSNSLLVVGAHPGAGATTVSVAVADAVADRERDSRAGRVSLIDAARREVSGMGAASESAVGPECEDWRAGRRGVITILRPVVSPPAPRDLPRIEASGVGWLVVDAGWPWREVMADQGQLRPLAEQARVVVVCRASVPGVRHAELALAAVPGDPLVAAVGARRWPAAARASFGPRLARVVAQDRAVLFPADRRVAVNGIDADAFPTAIAGAAARLVALLWPTATASQKGRSRGVFR